MVKIAAKLHATRMVEYFDPTTPCVVDFRARVLLPLQDVQGLAMPEKSAKLVGTMDLMDALGDEHHTVWIFEPETKTYWLATLGGE